MFNISKNIEVSGLVESGISLAHLQQCLSDKNLHDDPHYSYFGKTVSKGSVVIRSKRGPLLVEFDEKDNWARSVAVHEVIA